MPHMGGCSGAAANTGRDRSFKQQMLSSCWRLESGGRLAGRQGRAGVP